MMRRLIFFLGIIFMSHPLMADEPAPPASQPTAPKPPDEWDPDASWRNLAYEVDRNPDVKVALAEVQMAEARLALARSKAGELLITRRNDELRARKRIGSARLVLERTKKTYDETVERHRSGMISDLEVARAGADLAKAQEESEKADADFQLSTNLVTFEKFMSKAGNERSNRLRTAYPLGRLSIPREQIAQWLEQSNGSLEGTVKLDAFPPNNDLVVIVDGPDTLHERVKDRIKLLRQIHSTKAAPTEADPQAVPPPSGEKNNGPPMSP
jgi:multidrug efflux pump subunit AcrA (membrane-fusion protein)